MNTTLATRKTKTLDKEKYRQESLSITIENGTSNNPVRRVRHHRLGTNQPKMDEMVVKNNEILHIQESERWSSQDKRTVSLRGIRFRADLSTCQGRRRRLRSSHRKAYSPLQSSPRSTSEQIQISQPRTSRL